MTTSQQSERLDVRLSPENKELIAQAAGLLGLNLSSFTVSTLVQEARRVLDRHAVVRMSDDDRERFLALLDDPPEPAEALKRAARRHRESIIR